MTYNTKLAEQTMQFILDNPGNHNQKTWMEEDSEYSCGTVGCFFGWAAYLECHINKNPDLQPTGHSDEFNYRGHDQHVMELVPRLLRLSTREAEALYRSKNTIDDLHEMVKLMSNGRSPLEHTPVTLTLTGPEAVRGLFIGGHAREEV